MRERSNLLGSISGGVRDSHILYVVVVKEFLQFFPGHSSPPLDKSRRRFGRMKNIRSAPASTTDALRPILRRIRQLLRRIRQRG